MSRSKLMSKSIPERVITYTIWVLMFIYSLSLLALYIWVLYSSFKIRMDFNENVFGFPKTFTFDNYINAISNFKVEIFRDGKLVSVYLEELLLNSFLYILGCALAATIAPAIVAYATSRFNFRFNVVLDGIVIVTTPQDLVSMIVLKAAHMAEKMNIPILGIVENMSYITCPDCGRNISVFGESQVDAIALEHGITNVVKVPIDRSLTEAADSGKIETFDHNYYEAFFNRIDEQLKNRK